MRNLDTVGFFQMNEGLATDWCHQVRIGSTASIALLLTEPPLVQRGRWMLCVEDEAAAAALDDAQWSAFVHWVCANRPNQVQWEVQQKGVNAGRWLRLFCQCPSLDGFFLLPRAIGRAPSPISSLAVTLAAAQHQIVFLEFTELVSSEELELLASVLVDCPYLQRLSYGNKDLQGRQRHYAEARQTARGRSKFGWSHTALLKLASLPLLRSVFGIMCRDPKCIPTARFNWDNQNCAHAEKLLAQTLALRRNCQGRIRHCWVTLWGLRTLHQPDSGLLRAVPRDVMRHVLWPALQRTMAQRTWILGTAAAPGGDRKRQKMKKA